MDVYAKDGGPGASDLHVGFTMILYERINEWTFTQKMVDQGRSDLHVVFTMTL